MPEKIHTIAVATGNPEKVKDLNYELGSIPGLNLISLAAVEAMAGVQLEVPVEDGDSFRKNALLKAESYTKQIRKVLIGIRGVIAEDSGFTATALTEFARSQGLPEPLGVQTKGFYGETKGQAKTAKLLAELRAAHEAGFSSREGIFTTALILMLIDGEEITTHQVTGEMKVNLGSEPIWNPEDPKNIFAIDPVAVPVNQNLLPPITLSQYRQLSSAEKAQTGIVTHRAQAVAQLREVLATLR